MIRRSTLVLLTYVATLGTSAGTSLNATSSALANDFSSRASASKISASSLSEDIWTADSSIVAQATVTQATVAQATNDTTTETSSELDINSRGEAVKVLQLRLRAGEYYSGPIDGIYGLATERAVRIFQAEAGIEETGSINDETWQKLQLATGDLVGESTLDATETTDPTGSSAGTENVAETAPAAGGELPADGEAADIIASESEGGLGRVFGLSVGLMAVLASFGIGFFLANKDKADADEGDSWSSAEGHGGQEEAVKTSFHPTSLQANGAVASAETGVASAHSRSVADSPTYVSAENSSHGIAPLNTSFNTNGRQNGQMEIGQMGNTAPLTQVDIVDGLIGDLRNPDPARRRKAIWELGQRGNSVAMKPLVDAMTDADSKEKSLVLAALSEIGIRSLKPMSKALAIALQDDNPEVRKNAIRDLTRVYDLVVQISQMLGHATEDEDPEVRQTASWALEQLNRIRRSQDIDANVHSFSGSSTSTAPIELLSSDASLRRSSQQGM